MAVIDIFNIQPTQLCKDLSGKFVFLYGAAVPIFSALM